MHKRQKFKVYSSLAVFILALGIAGKTDTAEPSEPYHEDRVRVTESLTVQTVELSPGDAFALRRCPRGYSMTDLHAVTEHGGWMTQRATRKGYRWTFAHSDSRSASVRWYRPTRRYPWKPGVARNTSYPDGAGVTFQTYCQDERIS